MGGRGVLCLKAFTRGIDKKRAGRCMTNLEKFMVGARDRVEAMKHWFKQLEKSELNYRGANYEETPYPEMEKLLEIIRVQNAALENLSKWELHYKTVGGIFNPKNMEFERDTLCEGISNPAKEAIEQVEKIAGALQPD